MPKPERRTHGTLPFTARRVGENIQAVCRFHQSVKLRLLVKLSLRMADFIDKLVFTMG